METVEDGAQANPDDPADHASALTDQVLLDSISDYQLDRISYLTELVQSWPIETRVP